MERLRHFVNYFATSEANGVKCTNMDSNNAMDERLERLELENEGIIDPHHFILIQHGFLGMTSDFSGLIRTLMEDHANALSDARSAAESTMQSDNNDNDSTNKGIGTKVKYVMKEVHKTPFNGKLYCSGNRVCFVPGVNNLFGSITGTRSCALKMLREFLPVFTSWLADVREAQLRRKSAYERCFLPTNASDLWNANLFTDEENKNSANDVNTSASSHQPLFCYRSYKPIPVCFSCVGHSFGGVILREFLFLLLTDTSELQTIDENLYEHVKDIRETLIRLHVTFENFVTVASPHCGTSECLSPPLYNLAWYLSKLQHSKTIQELIHVDAEHVLTERLLNVHHLAALAPFRHRTLFANTTRDFLVGFGTSSLIFEPHVKDQVRMMGIEPDKVPCAAAFKDASVEVSEAIYLPLSNKRYHNPKHDKDCKHGTNSNGGSIYANNNSTYNSCNYIHNVYTNNNINNNEYYENNFPLNASMTDEERLANHRFLTLPESLHDLHDALQTTENTEIHLDEHKCKHNFIDFDLSDNNNNKNNNNNSGDNDDSNKKMNKTENEYKHNKCNQLYTRMELKKKNRSKSSVLQEQQQWLHNQHHHHHHLPNTLQQGRRARSGLLDNNELKCYNYHFPYSTSLREIRDNIYVENSSKGRSNVSSDNRVHKLSRATDNVSFDANCIDELQHNANYNNIYIGDYNNQQWNNNEITVFGNNDNNNSSSYNKTNISHSASMYKHNTCNTINQNNNNNSNNNVNESKFSAICKKNKKQIMEASVQNSLSMRSGLVRCQSNFIGPIESTHTIADIRAFYNAFHSFNSTSPSSESSVQSIGECNLHSTNNINNINKKFDYKNATSTVDSVDNTHYLGLHDYANNNRGKLLEHDNDYNIITKNSPECNDKEPNSVNHSDLQADDDTFVFDDYNSSKDEVYDVDNNDSFEFNSSDEDNRVEEPIFNCDDPSFAFTLSSMNALATLDDEDDDDDDNNIKNNNQNDKNANHSAENYCRSMKVVSNYNTNDHKCPVQLNEMSDQLHENAKTHNDLIKQSINIQLDDMMTISSERKSSREEYEIQSTQFHDATEMYDNDFNNDGEEYELEENDDDDRYIETVSVASKQSDMHHVHCLPHSSLSLSSSSPVHVNHNNNICNRNSNDFYKETDTPFTINTNTTEMKTENEEYHINEESAVKMKLSAIEAKDKKCKLSNVTSSSKSSQQDNNNVDIAHESNSKKDQVGWPTLPSVTIIGSPRKRNCEELPLEMIWLNQSTVLHNEYHDREILHSNRHFNTQWHSSNETNTLTRTEQENEDGPISALPKETESSHVYWQLVTYPFVFSWSVLSWFHHKILQLYTLRYASTINYVKNQHNNSSHNNINTIKNNNTTKYKTQNTTHHYNSHVNEQNMINKSNIDNQHYSHEYYTRNNAKGNRESAIHTEPSATLLPRLTRVNTKIYSSASISAGNSSPAIVELVSTEPHPHHEELEQEKHTHHNSHRHSARHKHGHRESSICFSKREYALLPRSCAIPRLIAETLRRHLDWRVRAIRYANAMPMAHIACLGTYDWLGASLAIAQAVSEEVATVLC